MSEISSERILVHMFTSSIYNFGWCDQKGFMRLIVQLLGPRNTNIDRN